jgi:WD40 repeat protein
VSALAFSPDDGQLASASFDRSVKLWNTTTGGHIRTLLHSGTVDCVAFNPDRKCQRLASGGEDKTVHIWDATGREVLGLRGHTGRCGCVAFSPDGLRLASASTDGTIRFWDATPLDGTEGQEAWTFTKHSNDIYSVAISPDGQRIASAGYDPVKVWDAQSGTVSVGFGGRTVVVFCVAWNGERIASAGSEGLKHAVTVWDARTGRELFPIPAGPAGLAVVYVAVAFSHDGYLVTGKLDGAVQVWDAKTGEGGRVLHIHQREVRGLVFSPDGLHLASSSDGELNLWDATRLDEEQEPRLVLPARVPGTGLNVAFSPDSRRLATGGEKNTVIIRDVQTGDEILTLWGEHSGEVYALAFSPLDDGRLIATAGEDSAVKVWDSHTGKMIRSFRGHTDVVTSLAFCPDGKRLISGSRDKTVKFWDVTQLSDSKH